MRATSISKMEIVMNKLALKLYQEKFFEKLIEMKQNHFVNDLRGIKDKKNMEIAKTLFGKNKVLANFQKRLTVKNMKPGKDTPSGPSDYRTITPIMTSRDPSDEYPSD